MSSQRPNASTFTATELDALADSFSNPNSVVDSWLSAAQKDKKLPAHVKLPTDYERMATRPARLGLGAKPEPSRFALDHESVFGNYQLKAQLTNKTTMDSGSNRKRPLLAVMQANGKQKRAPAGKLLRPVTDDDKDDSRANTVGKKTTIPLSSTSTGKRGRKAKKNNLL